MTRIPFIVFSLALLLCLLALVKGEAKSQSPRIELTPFAGFRGGIEIEDSDTGKGDDINGSPTIGLIADWPSGPTTQWELVYSLQQTDVDVSSPDETIDLNIHYFHIGGIYLVEQERYTPFVGFTLGATLVDPEGFDSETFFSFGFTGGAKFFPVDHIGIRLDGRAYGNVASGSGGILCRNGSCVAHVKGDLFWQFEVNLGLIIRY